MARQGGRRSVSTTRQDHHHPAPSQPLRPPPPSNASPPVLPTPWRPPGSSWPAPPTASRFWPRRTSPHQRWRQCACRGRCSLQSTRAAKKGQGKVSRGMWLLRDSSPARCRGKTQPDSTNSSVQLRDTATSRCSGGDGGTCLLSCCRQTPRSRGGRARSCCRPSCGTLCG